MKIINKERYYSNYNIDGHSIKRIYLYDDNGTVIHEIYDDIMDVNGNRIEQFSVLHIQENEKFFRQQNTEEKFVKNNMKKKINFSYFTPKKDHWSKEHDIILYLYVDNEFIKVLDQKQEVKARAYISELYKEYEYYDVVKLDIDGQIVTHADRTDYKIVEQKELQEQAKKIFDECIYPIAYIQQSEFNKIFNKYELVKREKPLLTDEI